MPPLLEFFFGRDIEHFLNACNLIVLEEENSEFVSFLCSDMGQNMMTGSSLSIHIESKNILCDNFNTNENFYNFLLLQKDEIKQPTPKQFLPAFSLEESEKCNFLTNKTLKYLLYKFNNWIESSNAEKIKIRHSSEVKDDIGLIKIEEKDNQFLIEKNIGAVEKSKPYVISMEKNLEIKLEIKKIYRVCRRVYQSLFVDIAGIFIQYKYSLEPDEIKQLDDDIKAKE